MVMRIFCDIETLPIDKELLALFPKVCASSEDEYQKLALTGEYGRVLTIGVIVEVDGAITHCGCLGRDRQTRSSPLMASTYAGHERKTAKKACGWSVPGLRSSDLCSGS
ncbi:MAG: hypothetical protein H0U54_10165 [Acidobacteria bacterium]|nr:hypothetical protein [Acidobacteriota bacterium]